MEEVFLYLASLNFTIGTKSDNPSLMCMKLAASVIAYPLTNLFNLCIETGTFPNALKTAEVVPIYESGDQFTCGSYRPISLVSSLPSIFEKCIYKQLHNYFTKKIFFINISMGLEKITPLNWQFPKHVTA